MSSEKYRFLGIDTETGQVVQFVDPVVTDKIMHRLFRSRYFRFTLHGYGGQSAKVARYNYDVNTVKKVGDYYVAVDVNYFASPPYKRLSVWDENGNLIAEKDIGSTCTFDVDEANQKVIYYNYNTGYVEEATLPDLASVTQLFQLTYDSAVVKYVAGNTDQIVVAPRNATGSVEIRDRSGNVVDSLSVSDTILDVVVEPENWVVATNDSDGLRTITAYRRSDKSVYGVLEKFITLGHAIDYRSPFTMIGNDKGFALVTEFGGWVYGFTPLPSNCLWYDDDKNTFVGTMWFSVFEFPKDFHHIEPIRLIQRTELTIPANSSKRVSLIAQYGVEVWIEAGLPLKVKVQIPKYINPVSYARIYHEYGAGYFDVAEYVGSKIAFSYRHDYYVSLQIENPYSTDLTATIITVGG